MVKKHINVIKTLFIIIIIFFYFSPFIAQADGAPIPKPDKYISEQEQRAVIIKDTDQEIMILSTTFKGDPVDFGWIIPVPSEPKVEKARDELFTEIEKLIAPQTEIGIKSGIPTKFLPTQKLRSGIDIIKTEEIGIYDVTTLKASDSSELVTWLKRGGYIFPESEKALLDDYTENNWFFIAVKVDPTKITSNTSDQFFTGHATPLKITFNTTQLIYPLKLTSLVNQYKKNITLSEQSQDTDEESSPQKNSEISQEPATTNQAENTSPNSNEKAITDLEDMIRIDLYIFTNQKVQAANFSTEYANWVDKAQIENLAYDINGSTWYQPKSEKMFLTKLVASMRPSNISEDLIIKNADDNNPIGVIQKPELIILIFLGIIYFIVFFIIYLLSPFGLMFIICAILQFLSKSQAIKIICWIFQILLFFVLVAFSGLWGMYVLKNITSLNYFWLEKLLIYSVSATFFVFLIFEIIIMITQIRKQVSDKYENQKVAEDIFDKEIK